MFHLAERGDHYKILGQLFFLLGKGRIRSIQVIAFENSQVVASMVPRELDIVVGRSSRYRFVQILDFYLRALKAHMMGRNVIITTGPEYCNVAEAIFFLLFSSIIGYKSVLGIRNVKSYCRSTNHAGKVARVKSWFLGRAASRYKCLAFESYTQEAFYRSTLPPGRKLQRCVIWYDRYSDYSPLKSNPRVIASAPFVNDREVFWIGLLGTIDNDRRDYGLLSDAIHLVRSTIKQRLGLVVLGASNKAGSAEAIAELRSTGCPVVVTLDVILSEEAFTSLGLSCSLLVSPLRSGHRSYGLGNGTGSFGDAIYLDRKVLIPQECDPLNEFEGVVLPYSDGIDLAQHLEHYVSDGRVVHLEESARTRFSSVKIFQAMEISAPEIFGNT